MTNIIEKIKASNEANYTPAHALANALGAEKVDAAFARQELAELLDITESDRISQIEGGGSVAFKFKTGELVLWVIRRGWCVYR
ncbi:MAG: hypothetical protein ACF8MF_06720 [Phycisphaerales bacterium JB052]